MVYLPIDPTSLSCFKLLTSGYICDIRVICRNNRTILHLIIHSNTTVFISWDIVSGCVSGNAHGSKMNETKLLGKI